MCSTFSQNTAAISRPVSGLHEVSGSECSTVGLLIIETYGDKAEIQKMEAKLKKIKGLVVKKMVFQE